MPALELADSNLRRVLEFEHMDTWRHVEIVTCGHVHEIPHARSTGNLASTQFPMQSNSVPGRKSNCTSQIHLSRLVGGIDAGCEEFSLQAHK